MQIYPGDATSKRKPINLTIREDILKEAKTLGVNASRAAEAGIYEAIRQAKEQQWLEENKKAINEYNVQVAKHGTRIKPLWINE